LLIVSTLSDNKNIFIFNLILIFLLTPVPGFNGEGVVPLILWVFIYFPFAALSAGLFAAVWPLIVVGVFFVIYMLFKRFFKQYQIRNTFDAWADEGVRRSINSRGYYYDNDQYIHYQIICPSYLNQIKSYFNYLKSSNLSLIFNFKLINQYDNYSFYPVFFSKVYNWENIKYTTDYIKFVNLANVRAEISKLYILFTSSDRISFSRFDQNYFQERFLTTNLSVDEDLFNAKEYLQHLLIFKTKKEKEN
jgi:hypothetical protein